MEGETGRVICSACRKPLPPLHAGGEGRVVRLEAGDDRDPEIASGERDEVFQE